HLPPGASSHARVLIPVPRYVTIHTGDSVTWHFRNVHTLETVSFEGAAARPWSMTGEGGKEPPLDDAAGFPFWFSGTGRLAMPKLTLLQQGGDTISSPRETRSSGFRRTIVATNGRDPKPYTLRFLKPGVYTYKDAAEPQTAGTVTVVARGKPVPSTAAQEQAGAAQLARYVRELNALA